jgi:hypothetical protein
MVRSTGGVFFGDAHEGVAQLSFLHGLSEREPKVPYPLTRDLPAFLSALRLRTPAVWVLFDIFIPKYRPRSAPRP